MALNSSGPLSIGGSTVGQSINLELGLSSTAQSSLNDSALRSLAGVPSGQIAISNFYGKSSVANFGLAISYSGGLSTIDVSSTGLICYSAPTDQVFNQSEVFVVNPNGTIKWARRISATSSVITLNATFFDSSGNVYAAGYHGPNYSSRGQFLIKFDSSGNVLFSKGLNYPIQPNIGEAAVLDWSGTEIHVVGTYGQSTTAGAIITGWSASTGALVRTTVEWNQTTTAGFDSYRAITTDKNPASEKYYGLVATSANTRAGVVKMDFAHIVESAFLLTESPTESYSVPVAIHAHAVDEIYATVSAGTYDAVIKFNSSGTKLWAKQVSSTVFQLGGVTTDSSGNVYVVGRYKYTGSFDYKTLIIKFSSGGTTLFTQFIQAGISSRAWSIKVVSGSMYLYGTSNSLAPFNPAGLVIRLPSDGSVTGTFGSYIIENVGIAISDSALTTVPISFSTGAQTLTPSDVGSTATLSQTSNLQIF